MQQPDCMSGDQQGQWAKQKTPASQYILVKLQAPITHLECFTDCHITNAEGWMKRLSEEVCNPQLMEFR